MVRKHAHVGMLAAAIVGMTTAAEAAVVYSNDFNGGAYTGTAASPAALVGQGAWSANLTVSAMLSNLASGLNTTRAVRNNATAAGPDATTGAKVNTGSLGLTGSGTVYVEFDFIRDGGGSHTAQIGIGGPTGSPMHFGILNSYMVLRGVDFSTSYTLYRAPNVSVLSAINNWYRLRAVINQETNSISIGLRDLTGTDPNISDSEFQTLYFDAAATQPVLNAAYTGDETTWNTLWLRTSNSPTAAPATGSGWIDNIEVGTAAVPEPSSLATTLLAAPLLLLRPQVRRLKRN